MNFVYTFQNIVLWSIKDSCMYVCMPFVRAHRGRVVTVSDWVNSQTVSMHHCIIYLHTFIYYRDYTKPLWCMLVMFRCLSSQRTQIIGKSSTEFSAATTLVYLYTAALFLLQLHKIIIFRLLFLVTFC
jgi:hypothetical protein